MARPEPTPTVPILATDIINSVERDRKGTFPTAYELGVVTTTQAATSAAAIAISDVQSNKKLFTCTLAHTAVTLNATAVTNWAEGDEITFILTGYSSQSVITFGTNILASGTITIPIGKAAVAKGVFSAGKIRIFTREISV